MGERIDEYVVTRRQDPRPAIRTIRRVLDRSHEAFALRSGRYGFRVG